MTTSPPHHPLETLGPIHPPIIESQPTSPTRAKPIHIPVSDPLNQQAPAILHSPISTSNTTQTCGTILVSGAGGGVSGPAGIYPSLADKLAILLGIPCIRLDYREPAQTDYCVSDMRAAFDYLGANFGATRFVVIGWSFGGSPCFTVSASEPERVHGVATIGSQTARTEGVKTLNPRPLLLLHGEKDRVLAPSCSKSLFQSYGSGGDREIRLFPGDDHGLTRHAAEVERKLLAFVGRCFGLEGVLGPDVLLQAGRDLVGGEMERVREMEMGRDLEGGERLF